jgi:hypothetical protein
MPMAPALLLDFPRQARNERGLQKKSWSISGTQAESRVASSPCRDS